MEKNYKEITANLSSGMAKLRKEIPEVMESFTALAKAATKDGALDKKTKEFILLALGIAGHCDGCIGFHTHALVKLGATREEFTEALSMAIYMGGGPSVMYATEALQAFDQMSE